MRNANSHCCLNLAQVVFIEMIFLSHVGTVYYRHLVMDKYQALAKLHMLHASPVNRRKLHENGEVFTPVSLAESILDALPDSFWKRPESTFIDPAAGFGMFTALAFFRFMSGLEDVIPDEDVRRTHIAKNVIFAVELDEHNASDCSRLMSMLAPDVRPNVIQADFLTWDPPHTFDAVVGNPPYNASRLNIGSAVWVKFVRKAIRILSPDGYIAMIHPPGWRKPVSERPGAGDIWNHFRRHGSLERLDINSVRKPPFPEVDWYVWHAGKHHSPTVVTCGPDTRPVRMSISSLPFLPNIINRTTVGLVHKMLGAPSYRFARDNKFRFKAADCSGDIPHAHFWDHKSSNYTTLNATAAQVRHMFRCDATPDFYSSSKVVMTLAGKRAAELYPVHFEEGTVMGVTTNVMYQIMDSDRAVACVRFFNSRPVRAILNLCQYSSAPHRKNELAIINSLRIPDDAALASEADLHTYYGLSPDEVDLVNHF